MVVYNYELPGYKVNPSFIIISQWLLVFPYMMGHAHLSEVYYMHGYTVSLASFPGSPPPCAHEYCVIFDTHEESRLKGHTIDMCTQGRAWERG